ncbi:SOS response-associated peptidase family protein [Ralstonia sp. 3PA37C10]|jgi:putative SOS response-associated peptidase YedK|uniref:SOS response-associated peptidase n=1 Tax=Ralstonia sp. 3PA37C10 TaxID=2502217 RepID=UPI0010F495BC|nr:SOS response-associated peptidase family protein [Ralstonia sp. 3PA37C10]
MCNNYKPSDIDIIHSLYRAALDEGDYPPEAFPDYAAPIVRANENGDRDSVVANFGFVPKRRMPPGVSYDTTNARSETVGQKPTWAKYWKAGQLCLVPARCIFEPNYEADPKKSTRYRIWLKDQADFAIAGLWRSWDARTDGLRAGFSFTMLTVNAEHHAVFQRMHKPGKEKRGVVMLPREHWDDWLTCRDPERARTFLTLYPADLMGTEPEPVSRKRTEPSTQSADGDLI